MFCEKCGKELSEGASFCEYCGAKAKKKKKFPVKSVLVLLVLLIVAGAGGIWYLNSDGYQCRKKVELAKECMAADAYEDALAYCEEARKLDETYVDVYLNMAESYLVLGDSEKAVEILGQGMENTVSSEEEDQRIFVKLSETYQAQADQYLLTDAYGDAISVLQEGIENMNGLETYEDILSDKLEEVYQAQAEYLTGSWLFQYDLMNILPEDAKEAAGTEVEMEVYFEFKEDGVLSVCVDRNFWAENTTGVVDFFMGFFPIPAHVSKIAGAASGWIAGFAAGEVSADYQYEIDGGTIYCTESASAEGMEAGRSAYSFTINGTELRFLEKVSESESQVFFVECPMELEKVEQ